MTMSNTIIARCSVSSSARTRTRNRRQRTAVLGVRAKKSSDGEDEDEEPYSLPKRLWTDEKDVKSAEEKASDIYETYITMAAVRVVMSQDDGFGNECSEDVVVSETTRLMLEHMERVPIRNSKAFLKSLLEDVDMKKRKIALRVIETRMAFASDDDFGLDWKSSFEKSLIDMESFRQNVLKGVYERSLSKTVKLVD